LEDIEFFLNSIFNSAVSQLQNTDIGLYNIITNPTLKLPSRTPDNLYCGNNHAQGMINKNVGIERMMIYTNIYQIIFN